MRNVKITMREDLLEASKAFASMTGSTVSGLANRLIEQHIKQFAPTLLQAADQYQLDAIASANSLMPDTEPAEDLG